MSHLSKISPLRVTSIEEAQRAIDQLTARVNELSERSTQTIEEGSNSQDQGGRSSQIIKVSDFDVGQVVRVRHKLDRAYKFWSASGGLNVVEAATQRDPKKYIDLIVSGPELIERYEFDAAATSHTFSGLDGSTAGGFFLIGRWVKPSATTAVQMRFKPNGLLTNAETTWIYSSNGSAVSQGTLAYLAIAAISSSWSSNTVSTFYARFHPETTGRAGYHCVNGAVRSEATDNSIRIIGGGWDSSANVESIEVDVTNANDIGTGSWLELWQNKPRATSFTIEIK